MAFALKKLDPACFVEDMPVAATFVSTEDSPHLKVLLKPVETKTDATGKREVRVLNTGMRALFKTCTYGDTVRVRFRTRSSAMLTALLAHRSFGQSSRGFNIDTRDETGFWRAAGCVEAIAVMTPVVKVLPKAIKPTDVKKMVAAATADLAERTDKDGNIKEVVPLALME
jgi:hypothetical protein